MEALEERLEIIRKEVDRASVITYIESWPVASPECKEKGSQVRCRGLCHATPTRARTRGSDEAHDELDWTLGGSKQGRKEIWNRAH
jgi:hypothetical protein